MREESHNTFTLFFRLGLWWRVGYGAAKFFTGAALLRWAPLGLQGLFYRMMSHELIEDPGDAFIHLVSPLIARASVSTEMFIAYYLIFWGGVEVLLAVNILRHKTWAYPVAILLIGTFTLYEIYRITFTRSIVLASVIVIDIFVMWVIQEEYMKLTRARPRMA